MTLTPRAHLSTRPTSRLKALAAAAALLCLGTAGAAPLDDLRRQVEASQFEQAYATVMANPQLIGDVHVDFLYGVAAINVGRIAEGLLALERHLAAVPANDRARLELARGYFLLGEYPRARAEFEFVLRYNPPANVRANIMGFLQAMQTRDISDQRASARFYAEAGAGYDSNVNSGTYRDQVLIGGIVADLTNTPSRQVPDAFGQVAVGGQKLLRVTQRFSVFAGGDLDHRVNKDERAYDLTSAGLYAGFTQLGNSALWRVTLGSSRLLVGGNPYRGTNALLVESSFNPDADWSMTAFAQYGEMRHNGADEQRDARTVLAGLMASRSLSDWAMQPTLGFRASWLREDNQRLRRDLSRDAPLLRLFVSFTPQDKLRVSAGLTLTAQKYLQEDLALGTRRADTGVGLDLVASYAFDANWSARLDASWTRNNSNQDLYDSQRKAVSGKVRYQF
jgi:tetratricopeptide (TPR) repeat protein